MSKKVLVLMGGFSAEREVSLVTGKNVAEALIRKGYDVFTHDLVDGFEFVEVLKKEKPDVVFNALHGNFGEDGVIQGFLDILQIPYTHSGLLTSALGMNKYLTKVIASNNEINVAPSQVMTFAQFKNNKINIDLPYVVKPVSDGSSVGVYIIKSTNDKDKVYYDDENKDILVEKYIDGKELTVSVLNGKALAVTEMRPNVEFYDYNAKYTDGVTQHIIPADVPHSVIIEAKRYAEILHRKLKCNTVSRSDFRYNEKDGLILLEINTNPGMTSLSLVPEQAKYVGIKYDDVCSVLVENAACRKLKE